MKVHSDNLKSVLAATTSKHGAKYELDIVRENPGYKRIDETAPELFAYAKAAIESLGLTISIGPPWGVSDANIFNDGKGLQCINLGYGGEMAHSKEEKIRISEIELLLKLMLKLVKAE